MSALTESDITAAAATYTVRVDRTLSGKRFRDCAKLIKGINGRRDETVYDPQHPDASSRGYVRNDCPDAATAEFDGAAKTWTVMVPRNGHAAASDLRTAISAYDATVERVPAPAPAWLAVGALVRYSPLNVFLETPEELTGRITDVWLGDDGWHRASIHTDGRDDVAMRAQDLTPA